MEREREMLPLLQEPMTKEEFERELLTLPPKEAESRREFWTLCEALQAMEDTKCPPPGWFIESFNEVLQQPSDERAQPWRELRHRLLEHMGELQRDSRATRQRHNRFRKYSTLTEGPPLPFGYPFARKHRGRR